MKYHIFLGFCVVLFLSGGVLGEGENEIKRGTYPFMALIYYSDATIVDASGARFQRGGVLIKLDWIVSAAIDHPTTIGFPHKTLLARLGATTIDGNFTLNEDMDEQEREVIQIVRPSSHHVAQWWITDITLLKTVHPFISTAAVAPVTVNTNPIDSNVTDCKILIFAKLKSSANEKVLMQMTVELLPPMLNNCGSQFNATSMACAFDSEETKKFQFGADFCVGNAGGPLMCEGEVVGLQTYIENNCTVPHLYQLLSPWEKFISCGTQEQCQVDDTCLICTPSFKDLQRGGDKVAHSHENLRKSQASESPLSDSPIDTTVKEDETDSATLLALDPQGTANATSEAIQLDENVEEKTDTEKSSDSNSNPDTTTSSQETSSILPSSDTATRTTKNEEKTAVEEASVSIMPNSSYQGEKSEEQTTSKLIVEIASQQQPIILPLQLNTVPKKRSNSSQSLTKSKFILMLLLVLTRFLN